MRYGKRLNRRDRKQQKRDQCAFNMAGKGLFVFENNTSGDLQLPKATNSGRRDVKKGEQFAGDDYFFGMVKSHDLRFIKTLSEEPTMEKKLILDQPSVVTTDGMVEFVQIDKTKQKLNENDPRKKANTCDMLLTEDPLSGIIVED